jgi:hypothetical protein
MPTQSTIVTEATKLDTQTIVAQPSETSIAAPINPGLTAQQFQFLQLPAELRVLVYKEVFDADRVTFNVGHSQSGDPLIRDSYNLVPGLLKVCKQIYQEMRPFYFSWTRFRFSNLFLLQSFLRQIGRNMRARLSWIGFNWSEQPAPTVFRMLAGLPNLHTICISIGLSALPYVKTRERLLKRNGIHQLLAIRGIKHLELSGIKLQFCNHFNYDAKSLHAESLIKFKEDFEKFEKAVQVIKQPRQPRRPRPA